ncbi:Por secretion system C-terminal sorting domain-containing protein [Dyadobacter sp. SG02]|uniref:T9SS type A sorting domain-containing protein n=1 Tax=Dyadobacter sp. SG02 TaxID=1855291 RepID=UPI0008BD9ED8|nr:T9SS type A sorting domain-containing protein [Dyadobacter sp. SG02]SEJ86178.1 Por secretion system C-terminal sorting domain-containing protein [Dyadobacter sp. SG02]
MKKTNYYLGLALLGLSLFVSEESRAQQIDINAGYGNYDPGTFPGYGNVPAARGIFYSSAGKTSGVIPPYTAQLTIALAPEVPWTGEAFTIPPGWEMDPTSTPTNLTFYNSTDWTTEDPYFEIPVRAIAARSDPAASVGTQVFNIGGDWTDDGLFNTTVSSVGVTDINLPVTLISFSAAKEGKTALLYWATSEETNSDRFEIERSANGKQWDKIGSVPSHRESSTLQNYSFPDDEPMPGQNLYRLKMVDQDNTFAYSVIRRVTTEGRVIALYPNPAAEFVKLDGIAPASVKNVEILSHNGISVYQSAAVSTEGIDIKKLAPGAYLLKITDLNGALNTQKLVIAR